MMFMFNETVSLQFKRSPLHEASKKGHTDIVHILVKHGANVNTRDKVSNL